MIYNYLFFHSHSLALKSKENKDQPIFISGLYVLICLILNIGAITILFEALEVPFFIFKKEHKFLWVLLLMSIVFGYYLYKGRYKKIYEKYSMKYGTPKTSTSIIIIITYYVLSVLLAMLAGMFKNGDWIFS